MRTSASVKCALVHTSRWQNPGAEYGALAPLRAGPDCALGPVKPFAWDAGSMQESDRWQVSDSAAKKYELHVASWFTAWAADLVTRAGVSPGWHVLDAACGTGVVSRAAGPIVGRTGAITASDLNEGMLEEARQQGVEGAQVTWRLADLERLPFEDQAFDGVLCQQGLQFVPDKARAVREIRRVLRPSGVVGLSVWRGREHNPYIAALAAGLTRYLSAEAGEVMLAPCGLGDRDELGGILGEAGFSSVDIQAVTLERDPTDPVDAVEGNLAALPIAGQIQSMDSSSYEEMVEHIVEALAEFIIDGLLVAPNSANVAVCRT